MDTRKNDEDARTGVRAYLRSLFARPTLGKRGRSYFLSFGLSLRKEDISN